MAAQPGFQGHDLASKRRTFYGRPDQIRLESSPSGEWFPDTLLLDEWIWFSQDGIHWTDNPEAWACGIPIIILPWDPRAVLEYALNPQDVSSDLLEREWEEAPRQARVIEVRLDWRRFLQKYFKSVALLRVSLSVELPPDHCPDLEALRRLGYEVPVNKGPEMTVMWLAKDNLWVEFRKMTDPPEEGFLHLEAQVQGTDRMTSDLEKTFRELLAAYGADPADWALARLHPQQFDATPIPDMDLSLREHYIIWLWIELATGRVSRMTLFGPHEARRLAFTYDEPVHLDVPQEALPSWKAEALSKMTEARLGALDQLVRSYQQKHGRFPEALMPETIQEILEAEKLTWPINPFTGRPMKEAKQSPGDYTYRSTAERKEYDLSGYGWDHSAGGSSFRPSPPLPPGTIVSPSAATPGGIPNVPHE